MVMAIICIVPLTIASEIDNGLIQNSITEKTANAASVGDLKKLSVDERLEPDNAVVIQQWLKDHDYYNDNLDGNLTTNASLNAVAHFQSDSGLEINGMIGNETIEMMDFYDLVNSVQSNGELSATSSQASIKTLQKFLKYQGYYTGSITGTYDEATVNAIKELQTNKGLESTGKADYATMLELKKGVINSGASAQAAAASSESSISSSSKSTSAAYARSSGYSRSSSRSYGSYGYDSIGDCWAHSSWYSSKLQSKGYTTRVVQYASSLSSRHRSVQIQKNGKWVDADYSGINPIYRATGGSSHGKVVG